MNLTPQQQEVIDEVCKQARSEAAHQNLIVDSRAGTAKTTTGKLALHQLHDRDPFLEVGGTAFNKKTSLELGSAIPFAGVKTFNGFGHGAMIRRLNLRGPKPDTRKTYKTLKALNISTEEFPDVTRAVALAKAWGMVPRGAVAGAEGLIEDSVENWNSLFNTFQIDTGYHSDPIGAVRGILLTSINDAWRGIIDFDDQLYLSVIYQAPLPQFDLLMVDECQDVSPIQRAMCRMMLRKDGRLLAFGDDRQAIYAFRGADRHSMDSIKEEFDAMVKKLTVSFRCPQAVVLEAQRFVPDIQPWDQAPEGKVESLKKIACKSIAERPGPVAILCRNNAPLVTACLRFIKQRIGAAILGRDIANQIVTLINRTKATTVGDLNQRIWNEIEKQREIILKKTGDASAQLAALNDKAECIEVLIAHCEFKDSIESMLSMIERMFTDNENQVVTLSTIHKSKGLEWPEVFILDPQLIGKMAKTEDQKLQEDNLHYVAITRSQRNLTYITLEGLS